MPGYVVTTCHQGTDWCIRNATDKDEPDEVYADHDEAWRRAQELAAEGRVGGFVCRAYDFSEEE